MKVKLNKEKVIISIDKYKDTKIMNLHDKNLDHEAVYDVIGILSNFAGGHYEPMTYVLIDFGISAPVYKPVVMFDVVDNSLPSAWRVEFLRDESMRLTHPGLGGFLISDLSDGVQSAIDRYEEILSELGIVRGVAR